MSVAIIVRTARNSGPSGQALTVRCELLSGATLRTVVLEPSANADESEKRVGAAILDVMHDLQIKEDEAQ